jgi:hypothetical protein
MLALGERPRRRSYRVDHLATFHLDVLRSCSERDHDASETFTERSAWVFTTGLRRT